jgi:hypothetical protein
MACMTAGMDFSSYSTMALRTSECGLCVHLHIGLGPVCSLKPSPRVSFSTCSTSGVHEPHEAEALVTAFTSSSVVRPWVVMAETIEPLQTPLQPQISCVSGMAATAALGSRPDRLP